MRSVFLLLTAVACAVPQGFEAPTIGYVVDTKIHRIRPLSGTPGAAVIGEPVSEHEVENALVSPDGSFAVFSSPGGTQLAYARGFGESTKLDGTPPTFDLGALSPSSTTAAVYAQSCGCVQVLGSLRSTPSILRSFEASDVKTIAVTDDGSAVAIASTDRVWIEGYNVDLPISAAALAWSADASQLAVIESSRKTLFLVSDLRGSAPVSELLTERDGLESTAAIRFAGPGLILVADAGGSVRLLELESRLVKTVDCPCKPDRLEPTKNANIFRLTGSEAGPVWILDTASESLRTLFIPEQAQ